MTALDTTFCTDHRVLNIFLMVKAIVDIMKIGVPILLIIMSMIELTKAVANEEAGKKVYQKVIKMMISGAIVFLIPALLEFAIGVIDNGKSLQTSTCWTNADRQTVENLRLAREAYNLAKAELETQEIPITIDDLKSGGGGNLASKMIEIGLAQVGKRGAQFQGAYGTGHGVLWCNIFTWWVSRESGVYSSFMSLKTASTEEQLKYFKSGKDSNVTWHPKSSGYTPKMGDYIMFNYKSGRNVSHIGIVVSVSGSTITYVHGNSGSGGATKTTVKISQVSMTKQSVVGYGSWY